MAEMGKQVRGGIQTGSSKMTHAIYLPKGPILNEANISDEDAGKLIYSNFSDTNVNKALGGRLSFLPLSNSSLEIGLLGQYERKIGDRNTKYEDVSASIYAFDLTYNKTLPSIRLLKFSGQYSSVNVEDINYVNTLEDIQNGAPVVYSFENISSFYYSLVSIRPIQHDKNFIKNSEFTIRF